MENVELLTHAGHHAGSYMGTWNNLSAYIGKNLSINLQAKEHGLQDTMRKPIRKTM